MKEMSESYVKTLTFVKAGDMAAADKEFNGNFVAAVKKLYTEAAEIYPVRFSKVNDWCTWTKSFYKLTQRTSKVFVKGQEEVALTFLEGLRDLFYQLHKEAGTLKTNDFVYALRKESRAEKPSTAELKKIADALQKAEDSIKTKEMAAQYTEARALWLKTASEFLNAGTVDSQTLNTLRSATEEFYMLFGVQFE